MCKALLGRRLDITGPERSSFCISLKRGREDLWLKLPVQLLWATAALGSPSNAVCKPHFSGGSGRRTGGELGSLVPYPPALFASEKLAAASEPFVWINGCWDFYLKKEYLEMCMLRCYIGSSGVEDPGDRSCSGLQMFISVGRSPRVLNSSENHPWAASCENASV